MYTIKTYKGLWMNPNVAVERFFSLVQKCGLKKAVYNGRFQKEREAWITGVFVSGLRQHTGQEYWVEVETTDSTPDTYGYYIEQVNNRNYRRIMNFEITEWEDHVSSLDKIVKNKIKKAYPDYFILLIYGRKQGAKVNLDEEFNRLQKSDIPFSEIWLIAATNEHDYQLTKLYPHKALIKFNLDRALENNKRQPEFGQFLKRSSSTTPKYLGEVYFPLPECDN